MNKFYQEFFFIEDLSGAQNVITITAADCKVDGLLYSFDKENWRDVCISDKTAVIPLAANGKCYFRGWRPDGVFSDLCKQITFSAVRAHKVGGNINTLVCGTVEGALAWQGCPKLYSLFANDAALVDAGALVLPAMTLSCCCYSSMFYGCSSLTTAPELPATTLAVLCYGHMFYGCTSLTKAPELPEAVKVDEISSMLGHTIEDCCSNMLDRACSNGCTSLK